MELIEMNFDHSCSIILVVQLFTRFLLCVRENGIISNGNYSEQFHMYSVVTNVFRNHFLVSKCESVRLSILSIS